MTQQVQQACNLSGGRMAADLTGGLSPPGAYLPHGAKAASGAPGTMHIPGPGGAAAAAGGGQPGPGDGATAKFFYTFLQRTWDGSPSSMTSN